MEYKVEDLSGKDMEMKKHLNIDEEKVQKILEIKLKVFNKEITPEEARKIVNQTFESVTAEEFAFGEQQLFEAGITNEVMVGEMNDIIDVFKDVLARKDLNLPAGHPIQVYENEAAEIDKLLLKMEVKLKGKFIINEWFEIYEQLDKINIHLSRKQNQLYSELERVGFDRPSRIMWTFDDRVRDAIKDAYLLLEAKKEKEFLDAQANVIHLVRDILSKERNVLYPTSLKLLSDDIFIRMQKGDAEIGYCLIDTPPQYTGKGSEPRAKETDKNDDLISDLKKVFEKHGISSADTKDKILDVATGKLTLKQINLIYKHMRMDLSYVDENNVVQFYTDTDHRVFPRSAGVIGRMVENCHPRESLDKVLGVIEAFRSGEQNEAEFWIESRGKFIYILFVAVRDEEGKYCGVLEMMQDVTRIRSLEGSRRLLSWSSDTKPDAKILKEEINIDPKMKVGTLFSTYPFLKNYLISLNPEYKRLNNTVLYDAMKNAADIEMLAEVGSYKLSEFIEMIKKAVHSERK